MDDRANRWAIVGGGVLGMALAHRLARRGERVTLYEAARDLGGLASAWRLGEFTWDRHYHVTLASDTSLLGLLSELGLSDVLRWRKTRTGFFTGGRFHSMSSSLDFLRFPPLGLLDKFRLGVTILHAARLTDWRPLEDVPVDEWLRRWSGKRTFETMWLPLLRAKLGDNYTKVSAAFIWATIARMYSARGTGGSKTEQFGYVEGGYARVHARFADVLRGSGVEIRAGARVRSVRPAADGSLEVTVGDGPPVRHERVVLTAPSPAIPTLCPDLPGPERAALEGIEYQGIVCASAVLARPLAGYYLTNITDPGFPFTAVVEMSALVDPAAFGGRTLVYLPRYTTREDEMFGYDDATLRALFLAGLRRMYPDLRDEDVLAFQVSRVRNVFALPTLGFSRRLPPMRTSVPGLFVVNSSHIVNGTLNVNETLRLADRAVADLS